MIYQLSFPEKIDNDELNGECDHDKCLIQVSLEQHPEMVKSTLLHESIHAAAHGIDWKIREGTVVKIEKMMFGLLRDNPELVAWILEKE